MYMKIEAIDKIYLVCEDIDEAINKKDDLINAGIFSTTPDEDYNNWVIRIEREPLKEFDYKELNEIVG